VKAVEYNQGELKDLLEILVLEEKKEKEQ